ncbi:hypothetical protein HMPREF1153_0734 [Selenomonas sp. CM52]|nr:hypothetical protein HMPREF1153_0734 [Selenomonas sp. CM52]
MYIKQKAQIKAARPADRGAEKYIGRRKYSDIELEDDEKDPRAQYFACCKLYA